MVTKNRGKNNDGEQATDEKQPESKLFGFRAVYVFDVTQTEGQDLPVLSEIQGDVSGYRDRLSKFVDAVVSVFLVIRHGTPPRFVV
jgi:hypothetical protein